MSAVVQLQAWLFFSPGASSMEECVQSRPWPEGHDEEHVDPSAAWRQNRSPHSQKLTLAIPQTYKQECHPPDDTRFGAVCYTGFYSLVDLGVAQLVTRTESPVHREATNTSAFKGPVLGNGRSSVMAMLSTEVMWVLPVSGTLSVQ